MSDKSEVYYHSAKELAGLNGMPKSARGVNKAAIRLNWVSRKREGTKTWEYLQTDLPKVTQEQLILAQINESIKASQLVIDEEFKPTAEQVVEKEKQSYAEKENERYRTKEENLAAFNALPEDRKRIAKGKEVIIQHYYSFRHRNKLSVEDGMKSFCAAFNAREIQFEAYIYDECVPQKQGKGWLKAASFKRWVYDFHQKGILSLVNNYGKRVSKIETNQALYTFVIGFIVRFPHAGGLRIKEALAADRPDLDLVGPRAIQRYIKEWKDDNAQLWTYVVYPDKWKSVYMSAQGSQHENISFCNQLWELDSTPGDWLLKDGRHSVVGVIDMYSRRMLFFVSKTSSADAVCQLFRRAILQWGVPVDVRTDNGKDYVSDRFTLALRELEIHQQVCIPFASEEKGSIERGLQTMSHGLLELETGFIGHNVTERKMIESRKSFAQRIMTPGEVVEIEMTSVELQQKIDNWNDHVYSRNPHGGLKGRSPFDAANDINPQLRTIGNERALDLLLQPIAGTRTVTKKGIRYENREYIAPELGEHVGRSALLRYDERDAGSLMVYINEEFICEAKDAELEGVSRQETAMAAKHAQKKKMSEQAKELKAYKKEVSKNIAEVVMQKRAEDVANIQAFPQQSDEYTSVALQQAAQTDQIINNKIQIDQPIGMGQSANTPNRHDDSEQMTANDQSREHSSQMLEEQEVLSKWPEPNGMNEVQMFRYCKTISDCIDAGDAVPEDILCFYKAFSNGASYKSIEQTYRELGGDNE